MEYPGFFNDLPSITLQDELSEFLGTFTNGIVEFSYLDIVKSAGHSCPTVLGAYLSCINGLNALFGEDIPKRGQIFISFKEHENEGVAGVIANVYTQITGATKTSGFKGIAGNFVRHSLMDFGANISSDVKMTRLDTNINHKINFTISSCHKAAVKIPAAKPAITSSPITPIPPFTFLSILPIIDGFVMSKYLKSKNDKIL